jgi:hypothetical protein
MHAASIAGKDRINRVSAAESAASSQPGNSHKCASDIGGLIEHEDNRRAEEQN